MTIYKIVLVAEDGEYVLDTCYNESTATNKKAELSLQYGEGQSLEIREEDDGAWEDLGHDDPCYNGYDYEDDDDGYWM